MEILAVILVLGVLSLPAAVLYTLYRIGKLENAMDELRRDLTRVRREAAGARADDAPPATQARAPREPAARSRAAGPSGVPHEAKGSAGAGSPAAGATPPGPGGRPTTGTPPQGAATGAPTGAGTTEGEPGESEPAARPKPGGPPPLPKGLGGPGRERVGGDAQRKHDSVGDGPGRAEPGTAPGAGAGAGPGSGRKAEPGAEPGTEPGVDAGAEPAGAGLGVEAMIGSTWLLRIGLGILAIALALFARLVAPQLSPLAKVALAYAGAIAFVGVGKYFEERLDRFAKPVMAGGLAFGFFVAFAAHFIPAMRAVSLPVSIVWMVFSMLTVLVAAERWRSESTAILAIVLGHVSAQASAGSADFYSLVMIGFLAITALVLLLRHGWIQLGLLGVAASYGAHFLWLVADRALPAGDEGFWLSLAFLTSYYVIFLAADLLWWHRGAEEAGEQKHARALGPANLVLYVSLVTFVYVVSGARVDSIEWYYLTLGAVQAALAWLYRGMNHRDFVYYPVFGTVLWTLGFFAWLDALVLNLVLASQALLLLLVARRTGLRVFYYLSQAAMGVAFVHYVAYPQPGAPTLGTFLGGLGIGVVYLAKAYLEEDWYETPLVAQAHAGVGGLVLVREGVLYLAPGLGLGAFLAATTLLVTLLARARRRGALLFAVTAMAAALPVAVTFASGISAWVACMGFAATALLLVRSHDDDPEAKETLSLAHGRAVAFLTLLAAFLAADGVERSLAIYLAWIALAAALVAIQLVVDRGADVATAGVATGGDAGGDEASTEGGAAAPAPEPVRTVGAFDLDPVAILTYLAIGVYVIVVTGQATASPLLEPVWMAVWASAAFAAYAGLGRPGLSWVGHALLFGGYLTFLNASLFAFPGPDRSTHPALASWWAGILLSVVPLAVAWALDRRLTHERGASTPSGLLQAADSALLVQTLPSYLMALLVAGAVAGELGGLGWMYLVPALVALGLLLAGRTAGLPRAVIAAVVGTVAWNAHFLMLGARAPAATTALVLLIAFALVSLAVERGGFAALVDDRDREVFGPVLMGVVALATLTGMSAVYVSDLLGPPWATAGWSVWAGAMMVAAFALRSAAHRRVALLLIGLCIVRVFAVDTVGLSDTARIGAFLVLGLILVGMALLYNRYSEELKSWL